MPNNLVFHGDTLVPAGWSSRQTCPALSIFSPMRPYTMQPWMADRWLWLITIVPSGDDSSARLTA